MKVWQVVCASVYTSVCVLFVTSARTLGGKRERREKEKERGRVWVCVWLLPALYVMHWQGRMALEFRGVLVLEALCYHPPYVWQGVWGREREGESTVSQFQLIFDWG